MGTLVFDPHGDDAALFCAYSTMQNGAHVIVTKPTVPLLEIRAAAKELGINVTVDGNMDSVRRNLGIAVVPDVVYAPAPHEDGHEEHNEVAEFVAHFCRSVPIVWYETYAPRGQRTRTDNEVPAEPWMIAKKLRALSCFESQIEQASTRPWFFELLDMREWVAE